MSNSLFSGSKELDLFSRSRTFRLHLQGSDMIDGEDGAGNIPGDAKEGVDDDDDTENKKIQVIARALLEKMFFPVDNNSSDLLVHEDEN